MTRLRLHLLSTALIATFVCLAWMPVVHGQGAAPGAPVNLQATVNGNNLSLTWGAPATGGAPAGYTLVARSTSGGPVLATVPLGNQTSFAAAGPNGVFVLSVVATNASGAGPESTSVTVTLPALPAPPGAPANLVTSALGSTATFSWTAPASGGVVGNYLLVAGLAPGFSAPIASLPLPASASSTAIPGVPPGTYYVRMLAQNAGGTSGASNEASLTIAGPSAPGAPILNQPTATGNTVSLSWTPGGGGTPTSYVLTAFSTVGSLLGTVALSGLSASIPGVPDGTYVLQIAAVNSLGTSPASNQVTLTLPFVSTPITQIGAAITNSDANFGSRLAMSGNGRRVAVTALGTANGTTRVYERSGSAWVQAGADIIGEAAGDLAGTGVDLNEAGTRLAIGAHLNDGGGPASGHVRVYDLVGTTWTQVGADLDGDLANWGLGWSVALSASGTRLVVGAPGVLDNTGRVKVYELVAGTWTQLGATMTGGNQFGWSVDISADGTTIAVSSPSAAGTTRAGSAQIFRLNGSVWTRVGNELTGEQISDSFGWGLSLNATGTRIVVGAPYDTEGDTSGGGVGAGKVRVFDLVGATWTPVGGEILGIGVSAENFGETVALSGDGTRLAATAANASRAKVYALVSGTWVQVGGNITSAPGGAARAQGLALAADGSTVAVGFVNGFPKSVRVFSITP